jgi:hypothetical protein
MIGREMKIAIVASFSTKRDMNINSSHAQFKN